MKFMLSHQVIDVQGLEGSGKSLKPPLSFYIWGILTIKHSPESQWLNYY